MGRHSAKSKFQVLASLAAASVVTAGILEGAPDPAPAGYEDWIAQLIVPSPATTGNGPGDWTSAYSKAKKFVSDLTREEKVNLTTGIGTLGRCVGNTGSIPRKKFDSLCLQDGPAGVRLTDYNSVFPVGINSASTFDKNLMYRRGQAMGEEFRGKGVNVALLPGQDILRAPASGRNWEMDGADPYLSGVSAAQSVKGVQSTGVIACAKHYYADSQEHARGSSLNQAYSSNIDDRTTREIWTWPFAESVQAGVGSVMCSYNRVNQTYACENSYILNGILKEELDFQGFIVSDWAAQTKGVEAALAGLDMSMPGFKAYGDPNGPYNATLGFPGEANPAIAVDQWFGSNLITAINNGTLQEKRLDDMATRIMAAYYKVGQDSKDYPSVNFQVLTNDAATVAQYGDIYNEHVDVQKNHKKLIREIGAASTVLLKNTDGALPLDINKIRSIGIFGSDAGPPISGANGFPDRGGVDGTVALGWGSGSAEFPYLIDPYSAILHYATDGDRHTTVLGMLNDTRLDLAGTLAQKSDVCMVFVAADSGEGYISVASDGTSEGAVMGDRNNLELWNNGSALINTVAANCSNTVVTIHAPSAVNMESWIENPNITAVLMAGMPGQESGNSLVDVVFGKVNPSGRLPYTIGKRIEDYSAEVTYYDQNLPKESVEDIPQLDYTEKLLVDYRHFEAKGITPRYAFGYGLSYTTFKYSGLSVSHANSYRRERLRRAIQVHASADSEDTASTSEASKSGDTASIVASIPERRLPKDEQYIYNDCLDVSFKVSNTGKRSGNEVSQLYVSFPKSAGEPPKVLRGFERTYINAGKSEQVYLKLRKKDLMVWSSTEQKWVMPSGTFTIHVGAASDDIRLKSTIEL